MNKQHHCQVFFAPHLSEAEIELRLQAIRLIQGVERIETEQTETLVPNPEFQAQRPLDSSSTQRNPNLSRDLIQQALVWGVTNAKISSDQINQLSSEELVSTALSLLDQMPQDIKQQMSLKFE